MKNKIIHLIFALVLVCGCGEDRTYEYLELTQDNQWIYECMKQNYLWSDSIHQPKRQDFFAANNKFLKSLLIPGDRFTNFSDSATSTSYGISYSLMRDPLSKQSRNYYALVSFVEPGSPAALAGLKRGDWISKMGRSNLGAGNSAILERGTATTVCTSRIVLDDETMEYAWQAGDTLQMAVAAELSPVGIYLDTVYTQRNSKIGYVVCNGFTDECLGSMEAVVQRFQQQQISDLIIDLRYNSGGSLGVASKIASMLVPAENESNVFCRLTYNTLNSDKDTIYTFSSTTTLSLEKIYIICGANTRGAAEVFIDALRQALGYNSVVIVGETTFGEDVATEKLVSPYGFSISPVVAHVGDADGQRTLAYGISPGYVINEFADFYKVYALGNKQEYLLYNVLYYIATGAFPQQTTDGAAVKLRNASTCFKGIKK